jgi:hypothetical protein
VDLARPRSRACTGIARTVAIHLGRDVAGVPLQEIADVFRLSRAGSAATIASRARKRINSDRELFEQVVRIREHLYDAGVRNTLS